MLRFIVLGIVPGTSIQLTFDDIALILLLVFTVLELVALHHTHTATTNLPKQKAVK